MGRPRRRGYQVAAGVRLVHGHFHIRAARASNIRGHSRITTARFPVDDAGGSQDLRAMAYGSDGFAGIGEVPDDFEDARVQADIFRRPAARDHEGIEILGTDVVEVAFKAKL